MPTESRVAKKTRHRNQMTKKQMTLYYELKKSMNCLYIHSISVMEKIHKSVVNKCGICQQSKSERNLIKMQMNIGSTAVKYFEMVYLDIITLEWDNLSQILTTFLNIFKHIISIIYPGPKCAILLNFMSHHSH